MRSWCIVLAAGSGKRLGAGVNKLFIEIAGRPVIWYTLKNVREADCFDRIVIVTKEEERESISRIAEEHFGAAFLTVTGGAERSDSVYNALLAIEAKSDDIITIHDGARCMASGALMRRCVGEAKLHGAAIAGRRSTDTVKTVDDSGNLTSTLDRRGIALVETPQVFRAGIIIPAYEAAKRDGARTTDDASVAERAGIKPFLVETGSPNIKITKREDLAMGEYFLAEGPPMRIGHGYDVHAFKEGRRLVLGGVDIPYEKGLDGHSDADVLAHAVIDALFGAAGLPDIGHAFPDCDAAYEGADSMELLAKAACAVRDRGFDIGNIDATLIMQRPKVGPYIEKMKDNMAAACGAAAVNVKATTTEKLGFAGRGEGAAAEAVVLLVKRGA